MKFIVLALFAVASAVPVPDDDDKLYLSDKITYNTRLSSVVYEPEKVEYKSVKLSDLSDEEVYVTLVEPKRYVEDKKPLIKEPFYKQPIYKETVYKKPVYKAPVVEYMVTEDKLVTPEFRTVPTLKTYSKPIVYEQTIYLEE